MHQQHKISGIRPLLCCFEFDIMFAKSLILPIKAVRMSQNPSSTF
jgi:hypothetical protein